MNNLPFCIETIADKVWARVNLSSSSSLLPDVSSYSSDSSDSDPWSGQLHLFSPHLLMNSSKAQNSATDSLSMIVVDFNTNCEY